MKLLYFYMRGCKECKRQSEEINCQKPSVNVVRLDVEDADTIRLCKKLRVGDAPTIVLMKDYDSTMDNETIQKNFIKKWVDFTKVEDINHYILSVR